MKAFSTISENYLLTLGWLILFYQKSASRILFWYLIFETLTPHQKNMKNRWNQAEN